MWSTSTPRARTRWASRRRGWRASSAWSRAGAWRSRRAGGRGREARCGWVGAGPLLAPLRRGRDRRGLEGRVHLLGRRDDVPQLVQQCALLLVASRHEGLCTAAIEAEALGIPVVATR